MRHAWKASALLIAIIIFPHLAWSTLNPNYDFTIVAAAGQTIDGLQLTSINLGPFINDIGDIVFLAAFSTASGDRLALFTPNHVLIKPGDHIDRHVIQSPIQGAINDSGEFVFSAVEQSGRIALFRQAGSRYERLAAADGFIDGLKLHQMSLFALNQLGEIVFGSPYTDQNGDAGFGLFTPQHVLVKTGGVVDQHVLSSIDNVFALSSNELFFHAFTSSGLEAIFTLHSVVVKTGDTISGFQLMPEGSSAAIGNLAVNNRGDLVFGATYQNGSGVFTPQSIVAQTGGLLPPGAAINDFGDVVYFQNEPGVFGLFVNQAELVTAGDSVGGRTINGFGLPPTINDKGQVLFLANFTGSTNTAGLILATPKK
jgi:hypothetical protein